MRKIMLPAAVAAITASPAFAQVNTGSGNGLVAVNVQAVSILNNFLTPDQIAALNNVGVPTTVQTPIRCPPSVCGAAVNALAALRRTAAATCNSASGSTALAKIVQRQKLKQTK